jgi:hypothetical protein
MGDLTGEPVAYLDRAFVEVPDSVTLSDILTFLTETDKKVLKDSKRSSETSLLLSATISYANGGTTTYIRCPEQLRT